MDAKRAGLPLRRGRVAHGPTSYPREPITLFEVTKGRAYSCSACGGLVVGLTTHAEFHGVAVNEVEIIEIAEAP